MRTGETHMGLTVQSREKAGGNRPREDYRRLPFQLEKFLQALVERCDGALGQFTWREDARPCAVWPANDPQQSRLEHPARLAFAAVVGGELSERFVQYLPGIFADEERVVWQEWVKERFVVRTISAQSQEAGRPGLV